MPSLLAPQSHMPYSRAFPSYDTYPPIGILAYLCNCISAYPLTACPIGNPTITGTRALGVKPSSSHRKRRPIGRRFCEQLAYSIAVKGGGVAGVGAWGHAGRDPIQRELTNRLRIFGFLGSMDLLALAMSPGSVPGFRCC